MQSFDTLKWYALQVRHNHEKHVAAVLRNKEYEPFLPCYRARHCWTDRTVEVESPLFPGYVFCRFDPSGRRVPIVTTPGVIRIVGGPSGPIAVDDREIAAVQTVIASGIASRPWPFLKTGQPVRICHGALAGLEGVFLEIKNRQRLFVSITLLQRSIQVDIDSSLVVPINPVWQPALSA